MHVGQGLRKCPSKVRALEPRPPSPGKALWCVGGAKAQTGRSQHQKCEKSCTLTASIYGTPTVGHVENRAGF